MMKVFVVDDSPLIGERLWELLAEIPGIKLIGPAVQYSSTPQIVLAAQPDVVILDLQVPNGSGINLLENLQLTKKPLVKIILSSLPNPIYRQRCLDAGADYFLDQTIDVNRLIEVITGLARDKSHLNNNYLNEASQGQGELE